jgi:Xaa-Pro aminopeptidase
MEPQRADRLSALMQRNGLQGLVCRIPQHVLMFTGYAPLLGNTFCVVSLNQAGSPEVRLVMPEQEKNLLPQGAALEIHPFSEETLECISNTIEAARKPLAECFRAAGLGFGAAVGYEGGSSLVATNYTQVGIPGPATLTMLDLALPGARWRAATSVLDRLAEIKTEAELQAIRRSAGVASQGFLAARAAIHVGVPEAEVAAAATAAMLRAGHALAWVRVVRPHAHVMTGARAAEAHKSFNLTTNAPIQPGDTVCVQLEAGVDGYWAELTRPFFAGEISQEWRHAHDTCLQAQHAALATLRDGAAAREVDAAARQVLQASGFGDAFKHGLGHGLGFQAIDHADAPVLHPASDAILRAGMVTNIEPAVYLEGKGGIRLNDDVAIQQEGCELLSAATPRDLDWLVVD